jgi:hypothetical protein
MLSPKEVVAYLFLRPDTMEAKAHTLILHVPGKWVNLEILIVVHAVAA